MATKFTTLTSLYPNTLSSKLEVITTERSYLVQNTAIQIINDTANNVLIIKNNDGSKPYVVLFDEHIIGFHLK